MDAESFTELALRVLSHEATEDERRTLAAELAPESAATRRDEFEQLKITHEILRATAPMAQAKAAINPELPAYRVNELRTAVRQHYGPASRREKSVLSLRGLLLASRWLFVGGGLAGLAAIIVLFCFANRTVEVGLYTVDLVRNGDKSIIASDVPSARLVQFDYDAQFEAWQNRPLAWYEHAKIWVDNEHDLLHIVRRVRHGHVVIETQPLAPTNEGQREQIKRIVESL